jgi:hypothetical protein
MNIEFSQQDLAKLDELIQQTPFRYAYPLFLFFNGKVKEAQERQEEIKSAFKGIPSLENKD